MMRISNYRRDPFSATFSPVLKTEIFQIPSSKIIQLTEYPLYSALSTDRPRVFRFDDLTELTETFSPSPVVDQFCTDYIPDPNIPQIADREGTARMKININTGDWVIVQYYGIGRNSFIRSDDSISYAFGLTENTPETILDYRGFWSTYPWFPTSTYISGDRYYSIAVSDTASRGLRLVTAKINQNTPTTELIANGDLTSSNWFKADSRVHSFLASDGRIGCIWTDSTNTYRGKISTNPLNASDMGGWTDIAFPTAFNQYACSTQIGNQVYFFGANSVLNTPSNIAVKYNADTQSGVLLANLPNNWQYGACEYDGNGGIWLIGNMLTGQVGQVLRYDILTNTYETKTAISGLSSTLSIGNGGAILNAEQTHFIITRGDSNLGGVGFKFTNILYNLAAGDSKIILIPDQKKGTPIDGTNLSEEKSSINPPANLDTRTGQINKYQNGIFACQNDGTAVGRTTIIRNTIKG